jgi:hypothetical protein
VRLADDHAREVQNHLVPQPSLSWQLKLPPHWKLNCENDRSSLDWLAEVRVLRGRDSGIRPASAPVRQIKRVEERRISGSS